jgi:glycine hydroxymethyltransferase
VQADDFTEIGRIMARALQPEFPAVRDELADRVAAIVERYPLYANLDVGAAV